MNWEVPIFDCLVCSFGIDGSRYRTTGELVVHLLCTEYGRFDACLNIRMFLPVGKSQLVFHRCERAGEV